MKLAFLLCSFLGIAWNDLLGIAFGLCEKANSSASGKLRDMVLNAFTGFHLSLEIARE
jgi:hypothetical protein